MTGVRPDALWDNARLMVTTRSARAEDAPPVAASGVCAVIGRLVVDPAHRRQGIGAALMAGAEAWARQQGCA